MPFVPRRLLVVYDAARGHAGAVVPRMKQMLEQRAFEVEVRELGGGAPDLEDFHGVVIGTPIGLRGSEPSEAVIEFVRTAEGLDEKKVAIFGVFDLRPGRALERLREALQERGAEVVVEHAYWRIRPTEGEQILPAECMVRIR